VKRKILSITGTRSDYGLMTPVFARISRCSSLDFHLIVTGMHLLPEFQASLARVREDGFGRLYTVSMVLGEDSGKAMAQSLGIGLIGISAIMAEIKPDILLLQGDRGEMLAGAVAAGHMNIPIVHMSGGDASGSIDDSLRHAISKFSHFHLTTCTASSQRLLRLGEQANRIVQVGEPALDRIREMEFISPAELARQLDLDLDKPIILAAQHPVTTEVQDAGQQIAQTLAALAELKMQTVFTYPNSDAGGREMRKVLESYRAQPFIRISPHLGFETYLSLMKIAAMVVGNSSSGILEAPSFQVPVVNIGTRQHLRLRAANVLDVDYDKEKIKEAILFALENNAFREAARNCSNPYGDGHTAERTVMILQQLKLSPLLLAKWMNSSDAFLEES
jgi:GDP/UDP-N,N'-diacetylbacillosamine 2-epimerase (hydrolysing)